MTSRLCATLCCACQALFWFPLHGRATRRGRLHHGTACDRTRHPPSPSPGTHTCLDVFNIPSHLCSVCQGERPLCPTTSHHLMWIHQPFMDMLKLAVPLFSSHPETCLNADMLSSIACILGCKLPSSNPITWVTV